LRGVVGRPRPLRTLTVVLLRDQSPVPTEDRVRSDDACHLG